MLPVNSVSLCIVLWSQVIDASETSSFDKSDQSKDGECTSKFFDQTAAPVSLLVFLKLFCRCLRPATADASRVTAVTDRSSLGYSQQRLVSFMISGAGTRVVHD